MDSILTSIKKMLGITEEDESFDVDITIYINTALAVLFQIGVGADKGFSIKDKTAVWSDFVQSTLLIEMSITYIYLKVRIVFDPPASSSVLEAINSSIKEYEWRIQVVAEEIRKE